MINLCNTKIYFHILQYYEMSYGLNVEMHKQVRLKILLYSNIVYLIHCESNFYSNKTLNTRNKIWIIFYFFKM